MLFVDEGSLMCEINLLMKTLTLQSI